MIKASHSTRLKPFKRRFTKAEDTALQHLVRNMGIGRWDEIAAFLPERNARQCRDRYEQYLAVSNHNSQWLPDDDELLRQKVRTIGPHWVEVLRFFPNRNINDLKNRWYKMLTRQATSGSVAGHPARPDPSSDVTDNTDLCVGIWGLEDEEGMDF
jgi:hypothetical protein